MTQTEETKTTETIHGEYKGLPIYAVLPESRGMEGGFAKSMQAIGAVELPMDETAYFGFAAIPKGERYDKAVDEGSGQWRLFDAKTDRDFDGYVQVQIFTIMTVVHSTAGILGAAVTAANEKIRAMEALKKKGQQSFDLPEPGDLPNASTARDEHGELANQVDEALSGVGEDDPDGDESEGEQEG